MAEIHGLFIKRGVILTTKIHWDDPPIPTHLSTAVPPNKEGHCRRFQSTWQGQRCDRGRVGYKVRWTQKPPSDAVG